jgi:hypothetical protein
MSGKPAKGAPAGAASGPAKPVKGRAAGGAEVPPEDAERTKLAAGDPPKTPWEKAVAEGASLHRNNEWHYALLGMAGMGLQIGGNEALGSE